MSSPLRIAVIGAGIMGTNHARVAKSLDAIELVAVVDSDTEKATAAAGEDAKAVGSLDEVLDQIDAAVVAVPTAFHHGLAMQLIAAGKHLLVEKPLAATLDEANEIVAAADAAGVVMAVGHIERFNAAVRELPPLLDGPLHVRADRISPYSPRILDGVVLDLMIHDLDIVLHLAGPDANVVSVGGTSHRARSDSEDMATASIAFDNGMTASFTTSRLGQSKIRQIEVTQLDSVVVADLLRQDITINRMTRHEYLTDEGTRYRQSGVVEIPFIDSRGEPLALELDDLATAVAEGRPPRVDGQAGLRALKLAHRVQEAVLEGAPPVTVTQPTKEAQS